MDQKKDFFKIKHNNILPSKGKILISEPFLQDPFFQRSVVLLVDHNTDGSMGFVLNKNIGTFLNDDIEALENLPRIPVYLGGPVASDRLFFIHTLGDIIRNSVQIGENLYCFGDFDCLIFYLLSGQPVKGRVKFFLGYSGWVKGQLDGEIKLDSWLVGKATTRNIMTAEGEKFWKQSVEAIGGSYLTWLNYPKNPLLN